MCINDAFHKSAEKEMRGDVHEEDSFVAMSARRLTSENVCRAVEVFERGCDEARMQVGAHHCQHEG